MADDLTIATGPKVEPVVRLGDQLLVGGSLGLATPECTLRLIPLDRLVASTVAGLEPCFDRLACFTLRLRASRGLSPADAHLVHDAVAGARPGSVRIVVPAERLRPRCSGPIDELRRAGVPVDVLVRGAQGEGLAALLARSDGVVFAAEWVAAIDGAPGDVRSLVQAVGAARQSGLDVHAEGVRTPHQAFVLGSLGCLTGEGPFAGEPLSVAQLCDRLADDVGSLAGAAG